MIVPRAPVCVAETKKQSPNEATTNRVDTEPTAASNDAAGTGNPGGVVDVAMVVVVAGEASDEEAPETTAGKAIVVLFFYVREENEQIVKCEESD